MMSSKHNKASKSFPKPNANPLKHKPAVIPLKIKPVVKAEKIEEALLSKPQALLGSVGFLDGRIHFEEKSFHQMQRYAIQQGYSQGNGMFIVLDVMVLYSDQFGQPQEKHLHNLWINQRDSCDTVSLGVD